MQRPLVGGQRGFLDNFRQLRMRMAGARDVFAGGTELHGHSHFHDQVAGGGADEKKMSGAPTIKI